MPEYRRAFVPGGTFFFTIVAHNRRPLFKNPALIEVFRSVLKQVREEHPFTVDAAVVLPDHLHFVRTMPPGDSDYSSRIGRIKARFTKAVTDRGQQAQLGDYADVWQPRFWEHWVPDREDYNHHLDYVHYNPVKHGYVKCPHQWSHSSFETWVQKKGYLETWCCCCDGRKFEPPDFTELSERVGE